MSETSVVPESLLFVLGIQRSGTTWLANILDSSPDTLLFMEPFAPAYGLFPELPDQGFFFQSAPAETMRLLREETYGRLLKRKRLHFARSLIDPRWFKIERATARFFTRFQRYLPARYERRVAQFTLLNLNRFEDSFPLYPKAEFPRHWVVKELRVAGKIPLLRAAFPDARYLVVLRSPHATVDSMLRWFARGGLGEVKGELNSFVEKLECQRIAEHYGPQIEMARAGGVAHRAALYWRVCFEEMVRALERENANYQVLPYEALASRPQIEARALLNWAGIPWNATIAAYLEYSTSREVVNPAATNTLRRSSEYYLSWRDKLDPCVYDAVETIVNGSPLVNHLIPFYPLETAAFP
jgi:hypothetical protein